VKIIIELIKFHFVSQSNFTSKCVCVWGGSIIKLNQQLASKLIYIISNRVDFGITIILMIALIPYMIYVIILRSVITMH